MFERVLVIVNSSSGTGCPPGLPGDLLGRLLADCPGVGDVELAVVSGHAEARAAARGFASASCRPAAVIAGGGGGTLRAAVEGIYDAGPPERIVAGALRMGSGNVMAKRLGIARDPREGIRQIALALREARTVPSPVIRCSIGAGPKAEVRHAVVMCGLGQWGRCSGDLARWHRAAPYSRAAFASAAGIERVNHVEYLAAAGGRLLEAAVRPSACEDVLVRGDGGERYRLLAGAAITGRIAGIPFDPHVEPGEAAAGVLLVSRDGRVRRFRLTPDHRLSISLLDRPEAEFFLDEDPEVARGEITLDVAGTLPFLCAEVAS